MPSTGQLRTSSKKVSVKYVGPVVVYKIIDCKLFLLCTLNRKFLLELLKHDKLKPVVIRTNQGDVAVLPQLKQVLYACIKFN